MYATAQGIEAYVYEDKIEDADADGDGQIVFEEFLGSYAKPKPIVKNLLIMAINTAVIYFILQAPFLDTMIKVRVLGVCCAERVLCWHGRGLGSEASRPGARSGR